MREITKNITPWNWTVHTTGREMYRLAEQYAGDVMPYIGLSLEDYFCKIAKIPYRRDPDGEEYLSRPLAIFQNVGRGLDCDQKAIAIASYLYLRGIPYKFIAVGKYTNKPLHHVLVIAQINGKWLPLDATYPHCTPFVWQSEYERQMVLKR